MSSPNPPHTKHTHMPLCILQCPPKLKRVLSLFFSCFSNKMISSAIDGGIT